MNLFAEPVALLKRNFYWGIFQGIKGTLRRNMKHFLKKRKYEKLEFSEMS